MIIENPLDPFYPFNNSRRRRFEDDYPWFQKQKQDITTFGGFGLSSPQQKIDSTEDGREFSFMVVGMSEDDIEVFIDDSNTLVVNTKKDSKFFLTKASFKNTLNKYEEVVSADLENGILTVKTKINKQTNTEKIKVNKK